MGEYDNKEFKDERKHLECGSKEIKEDEIQTLDNDFGPLDENKDVYDKFINYYSPNDENDEFCKQFEVNFIPKDEDDKQKSTKIKKFKIKTASFYEDARGKLNKYLDNLLENYPDKTNSEDIITKTQLAKKLKVSKPFVIDSIRDYLTTKYGKDKIKQINDFIWPQGPREYRIKRRKLESTMADFMKKYPYKVLEIRSLQELADKLEVERNTITDWLKKLFSKKFGQKEGNIMFEDIWTKRQGSQDVRLKFEYLEQFIKNRKGSLKTTKKQLDSMKYPSQDYVDIECKEGHLFKTQILHLLYHNNWCPTCNERFCHKITRLYMESIFNSKFPETSFKRTYGLSTDKGGLLRWDGYNSKVKVNDRVFRIAFEYDGIQHDRFPNPFHKSVEDFERQQESDKMKNNIAKDEKFKTIIIRLKSVNGFDRKDIHRFQREIMSQFFDQTGIKLPLTHTLVYDPYTNRLKSRKGPLDNF